MVAIFIPVLIVEDASFLDRFRETGFVSFGV
jgi:hypothetical protein